MIVPGRTIRSKQKRGVVWFAAAALRAPQAFAVAGLRYLPADGTRASRKPMLKW
jgi:hypothetical protein